MKRVSDSVTYQVHIVTLEHLNAFSAELLWGGLILWQALPHEDIREWM